MKVNLKSSLSVFFALMLGCGVAGAKNKEVMPADAAVHVTAEQAEQKKAEEAKKKAQEVVAAVETPAESQEIAESVTQEADPLLETSATEAVR